MEPFIIMSQGGKGDDGYLTLNEIMSLKLDTELVVLSACVTGQGWVMEGEGVMNFARAFQQAGARSVVVSLWDVPSYETVEFMTIFYKNLKEGNGKAKSLLLKRKEMKKAYANPFYWGVFILYGQG
jgi:CHAT domain-containing protein